MTLPVGHVETRILTIWGHRVMIDADLADLYGVPTKALNQAVKRNAERFPEDFMFRLTAEEADSLRSQFVPLDANLKSQSVTSSWGGRRRSTPNAFTEQGVSMLSSVLQSPRAVQVNISIIRAFVALRRAATTHTVLSRRLDELERKFGIHDAKFRAVFEAIRELMEPPKKTRRNIGF